MFNGGFGAVSEFNRSVLYKFAQFTSFFFLLTYLLIASLSVVLPFIGLVLIFDKKWHFSPDPFKR